MSHSDLFEGLTSWKPSTNYDPTSPRKRPIAPVKTGKRPAGSGKPSMAFGRSNSLSLNTGSTNSLFAQQQQQEQTQQNTTSQPQQGSTLFGGAQNQQQPQQGGGLFGSSTTSRAPQSGDLFGKIGQNNQSTQPQQTGGLFSKLGQNAQTTQPQQTGGLFGSSPQQNQQTQPQQSGGLFGGSLFGNKSQNEQQHSSQLQQTGGLFGSTASNQQSNTSGLFGTLGQNNQQQSNACYLFGSPGQKPQQTNNGSSIFGNTTQPQQTNNGSSIFGNTTQPQQTNNGSSIFGNTTQPQQNSFGAGTGTSGGFGGSIFNSATVPVSQAQQQQPSLLAQSLYNMSQTQTPSFLGSLTLGQANAKNVSQAAGQQQTVPGVKIDLSNLKGTTRFSDCHDQIKSDLENIDKLIQNQEESCRQIEALILPHDDAVNSVKPDVELVTSKADDADASLAADAQSIQGMKAVVRGDVKDFQRVERVITNLLLPTQFHVPGVSMYGSRTTARQTALVEDEGYDTDLVGNYFNPLTGTMKTTLDRYAKNLVEIEAHLRVLEQGAVQQATVFAAKRAGMGMNGVVARGEETVRELAETLAGFEQGILAAAGVVGQCREGVNELALGRLGGGVGGFEELLSRSRKRY